MCLTQNKPINAHGGGFIFYNNTYYWYGEIKVGILQHLVSKQSHVFPVQMHEPANKTT